MKNVFHKRVLCYWNALLLKTFFVSHFPTSISTTEVLFRKHFSHPRTTTEMVFGKTISHSRSLLRISFSNLFQQFLCTPTTVIKALKHKLTYLKMLPDTLLFLLFYHRRPSLPSFLPPTSVTTAVVGKYSCNNFTFFITDKGNYGRLWYIMWGQLW